MRNINNADPWQIAFYKALAFLFPITLILFHQHRLGIVTNIKKIGYPGMAGGFLLMLANLLIIQSFANTSVANALFTLSSIPFITAILAFIFLKEKISLRTIIIMIFAFMGIFIMIKDGLETGGFYGNIMALFCAFSFSAFVIILRKYRNIDMMPVNLISGVLILMVSFYFWNFSIPVVEVFDRDISPILNIIFKSLLIIICYLFLIFKLEIYIQLNFEIILLTTSFTLNPSVVISMSAES